MSVRDTTHFVLETCPDDLTVIMAVWADRFFQPKLRALVDDLDFHRFEELADGKDLYVVDLREIALLPLPSRNHFFGMTLPYLGVFLAAKSKTARSLSRRAAGWLSIADPDYTTTDRHRLTTELRGKINGPLYLVRYEEGGADDCIETLLRRPFYLRSSLTRDGDELRI